MGIRDRIPISRSASETSGPPTTATSRGAKRGWGTRGMRRFASAKTQIWARACTRVLHLPRAFYRPDLCISPMTTETMPIMFCLLCWQQLEGSTHTHTVTLRLRCKAVGSSTDGGVVNLLPVNLPNGVNLQCVCLFY